MPDTIDGIYRSGNYYWEAAKSDWLQRERGITFEEVVLHLRTMSPRQRRRVLYLPIRKGKHAGQAWICVFRMGGQDWVMPYIPAGDGAMFLKTCFPSSKWREQFQ